MVSEALLQGSRKLFLEGLHVLLLNCWDNSVTYYLLRRLAKRGGWCGVAPEH